MMAAAIAAQCGAKTILIEKNDRCGRKLLITGKGRCNITHADDTTATSGADDAGTYGEPGFNRDSDSFIQVFGRKKGRFLMSALERFSIEDTLLFFNKKGLKTKIERGNRVFPVSDSAADVLSLFVDFLDETGVQVINKSPVLGLDITGNSISGIRMVPHITADNYILCTGGLSYPGTGSSGDGFKWAEEIGHTVVQPLPALVPLKLKDKWTHKLQGLSLRNTSISVFSNNKKRAEAFGEALFTHDGISGPIILDLSSKVGALLEKGPVQLLIDLKPALDYNRLDDRVQRDFQEFRNKKFKNSLDKLLPKTMIPVFIELSGIPPEKKVNLITRMERKKLLHLFKELTVNVHSLYGFEKAIITAGGIALKEVSPSTMRSKLIDNLY
ncbi:MAG: aminoacetone oxidase family FAD-binding enzyme, partial [bacterium]|nr:aminoacetone oxidase family FAD-binding enzyme [bacterium]